MVRPALRLRAHRIRGLHLRHRVGVAQHLLAACPCLDARSAPRGVDDSYGDAKLFLQPAREPERDGGELPDVVAGRIGPAGTLERRLHETRRVALDLELAHERRILLRREEVAYLRRGVHLECHVALSGREPHLADHDVVRRSGRSGHGVGDDELPRTSRLLRREAQRELAVVANAFPHLDAGEPSAHLRIRRGPSPDRYLLLALQHCAVAEQPSENHRLRGGRSFANHRHRASAPRAPRAARRRNAVLHVSGACGDDVAPELDVLRRVRTDRSVRVDDLGRHVRQIADALARKAHVRRRACRTQHGRSAVGVNGLQFARLVGKLELRPPVGVRAHVAFADEPSVQIELHLRTARVYFGDDLLPLPALEVPALPRRPHAPARLLDLPAPSVRLAHGEVCRRLGIPQRLAPVRDRFAPSGQVDVAAVRSVPRE